MAPRSSAERIAVVATIEPSTHGYATGVLAKRLTSYASGPVSGSQISESLFKGRWPMSVGSFLQAAFRSYNICKSRVPVAGVSSRRGLTESKYVAQLLSLGLKFFNEGSFSSRA